MVAPFSPKIKPISIAIDLCRVKINPLNEQPSSKPRCSLISEHILSMEHASVVFIDFQCCHINTINLAVGITEVLDYRVSN